MDGITCIGEIRRLESAGVIKRHIPVIAVTANARFEQMKAIKDAGMDEVIAKPFHISEIVAKITQLLSPLA